MFLTFEPIYLEQLGADPVGIGLILGTLGISMTISQAPAGYLADRFGRRPILIAAWVVGLIATGLMALATGLSLFVTGLLLYGLTAWVTTPLNSYVTAARGNWSVGRSITLISATFFGGSILGPVIGGLIGDALGLRYTYITATGIFLISTVFIFFIHSQPIEEPLQGTKRQDLLKNFYFLRYLTLVAIVMLALFLPQPLSPNFLQNQRSLSLAQIGQLVSVSNIGIVVLNLFVGQLPARMGFLISQATVGAFALFIWKGTGFPWYIAGYFLLGGQRVARNLATAQVRDLVHPSNMGLAYGITETTNLTATILAPPIAGFLYTQNPELMYPISLLAVIATLLLSFRYLPNPEKEIITRTIPSKTTTRR